MGGFVRINLGSGKHNFPNAINIDFDERADIVGPVDSLSDFASESVDEIYAIHLFEHLKRIELMKPLMEWKRVLKQGGKLVLEMPCLDKIAKLIVDGEEDIRKTQFGLFGDVHDPNPYMRHQWCYTVKEITLILKEFGFSVEVSEPIFHYKPRDMRITAVK